MIEDRLRYLQVVAETQSVRKAAELCRRSPAAISRALKQLEAELGVPVLVPSGRGILVTEEARALVAAARPHLEALARLAAGRGAGEGAAADRVLRLGTFEVFSTYFLAPLVRALGSGVALELRELGPGRLEEAIAARHVDYGLTYVPIPHSQVEHVRLAQARMGVFGRAAAVAGLGIGEWPFVVPVFPLAGTPTKVEGLDGWPEATAPRRVAHRVTLMESALSLCRQGLAVAYLPRFVATLHNELAGRRHQLEELPAPRAVTAAAAAATVYVAKRREVAETRELKALARAVREALAASGAGVSRPP